MSGEAVPDPDGSGKVRAKSGPRLVIASTREQRLARARRRMDRIAAEEGVSILEALAFDRTDPAAVELATRVSTFRIHDPQLQVRAAQMQAAVDRHRERLALGEIGGRHLRYLLDVHAPPEPRGLVVVDLCDLTPPANQP